MNAGLTNLLFVLALSLQAAAQSPLDVRIEVDREGLYEVSWFELAPFTGNRPLDTERLRLTRNGAEVPISFRAVNGTRFDRPSALQFHAEASANPHSKRVVYRLQARPGILRIPERAVADTSRTVSEAVVVQRFEEDLVHDPMATVQERWLDLEAKDRSSWFWARLPPEGENAKKSLLLRLDLPSRPVDRSPAVLVLRLRSHLGIDCEQTLRVEFAGVKLGERSWKDANTVELEFELPLEALKSDNILRLENASTATTWTDPGNQVNKRFSNDILLDSVELRFKTLLTGPTARDPQLDYEIRAPKENGRVLLRFTNPAASPFRLYDVARAAWLREAEIDVPGGATAHIVACSSEGFRKPVEVTAWSDRDLRRETEGGDWVCVTLERFAEFVEPLVEHRRGQGLKTLVVSDREIYDAFSGGDFDPAAITRFLAHGLESWKTKPRYLLLIGDADLDVDWVSERRVLPTRLVPTYYNGMSASDRALMPNAEIAVGRFPARRADEVIRMVTRTVEYERNGGDGGAWRRRLNFIASEGRFGPMVDALIERYAAKMLTEIIPAAYDVTMTYASSASAYLYPPAEFNAQVIRRFNEGALVFAYMGHGYAEGFDQLRVGERRYPIFSRRDLDAVDAGSRSPLAVIVACSTAEFDRPVEDSIAEGMMRGTGGPLGLIGGTRITHPFPNSLLSKELLGLIFAPEAPTIGEALTRAQAAMIADWKKDPVAALAKPLVGGLDIDRLMRDHAHLYVLFGDPAARLTRPREAIEIEAPARLQPGSTVVVTGTAPGTKATRLVLTLELRRDRIARPLERVDAADERNAALIKANYELANEKVLLVNEIGDFDSRFSTSFELPKDLPAGPAVLKAVCETPAGLVIGALPVVIEQPAAEKAHESNEDD